MSRVVLVFTGGTISMRPNPQVGGALPALDGAAIIARASGLTDIAELETIDWGLVPASHLGFDQLLDIAHRIDAALARPDISGAVVVQGTDTIEETALAFDLLVASDKPVVVTGAMRNSAEPDYDGPRNLRDAVTCAVSPQLHGFGTLVVLDGLIIRADQAVKTHTTDLATFQARDGRPLGRVVHGRLELVGDGPRRVRLPSVPERVGAVVHLITATVGMDGLLLRLLGPTRPAGMVVAATGAGNTHYDLLDAAREVMADGAVVCLTTRCPTGSVVPAYAFPGGGLQWERAGAILTPLDGPKARVALALGLSAKLARKQLLYVLHA